MKASFSTRNRALILGTGALLLSAVCISQSMTQFTGWADVDGAGQLQYRWKNYLGGYRMSGCSLQFRNMNGSDRKEYRVSIDAYDKTNGDHTESAYITFYEEGDTKRVDKEPCERVKGVLARVR